MKLYLLISQTLYAFSIVPWFIIWGLSFMSFDSGISTAAVLFVSVITLYPVAVILSLILSWKFRVKKKRFAIWINLLPLLWILPLFYLIVLT